MTENIEIRTIVGNRNLNTVSDSPVTDPASGAKGLEGTNAFVSQRSKLVRYTCIYVCFTFIRSLFVNACYYYFA
jgi:hypothetical protein